MKKVVILVILFSLFLPTPAQAFLNRDCSNLKKRVNTNQVKYEKAWDKYQTALGKYLAIQNPRVGAEREVANRLRVTYSAVEVILLDMKKYPKCLSAPSIVINKNLADTQKAKGAYVVFRWGAPLSEVFNFRTYLK